MPLDATFTLLVLGALLEGFVSGLAGFGGGPVVLVLWLLVIEPKVAVPLLMVSAVAHQGSPCSAPCSNPSTFS